MWKVAWEEGVEPERSAARRPTRGRVVEPHAAVATGTDPPAPGEHAESPRTVRLRPHRQCLCTDAVVRRVRAAAGRVDPPVTAATQVCHAGSFRLPASRCQRRPGQKTKHVKLCRRKGVPASLHLASDVKPGRYEVRVRGTRYWVPLALFRPLMP